MESANSNDARLFNCSFKGDLEGVKAALTGGGNVGMRNDQGFTPLLVAALNGHRNICGILLAHGSNVNEMQTGTKHTALHFAAVFGHNILVEALLSWGVKIDFQSHAGQTALFLACQEGQLPCVLTLLKAGAKVTLQTIDGAMPLHIAAQLNRVDIARILLAHGCSPDIVSYPI